MSNNTWLKIMIKVFFMILFLLGLHKNMLASFVSEVDVAYLTSFKNVRVTTVIQEPLHLAQAGDTASLLVQPLSQQQVESEDQEIEVIAPDDKKKSIYIYNTHQYEQYASMDVMDGARFLAAELEKAGYEVIVEENDFEAYKRENGMDLTETYPTSRIFLEKQLASHGPFDLIIDFHRDSISKEASTYSENGISYAKMMMVISLSADYHEEVEANSAIIHQEVDALLPGIMRYDFKREYAYYNQQYAHHMVLMEIGGMENTFEEVQNSLRILAVAIDRALEEGKLL